MIRLPGLWQPKFPSRDVVTHDYRDDVRGWGHDRIIRPIDGGQMLKATGWGPRSGLNLRAGDFMLLTNPGDGLETRYRVGYDITYGNPSDMWSCTLHFAPRKAGSA